MLQTINKEDSYPSSGCVRALKVDIFVAMFRAKLQSLVWSRHVGGPAWYSNTAAGKQRKHLKLILAMCNWSIDFLNRAKKKIYTSTLPNTKNLKTAKSHEMSVYFSTNATSALTLCHARTAVTSKFKMRWFPNERILL